VRVKRALLDACHGHLMMEVISKIRLGRGLAERGWNQKKLPEIMFEMDKALVSGQYTTKMVKSVQ
jgi:ribosome-binding factor A